MASKMDRGLNEHASPGRGTMAMTAAQQREVLLAWFEVVGTAS